MDEGGDSKLGDRIHQRINTFFEVDWKLWGNDATRNTKKKKTLKRHHRYLPFFSLAYSQAGWDELEPGKYEFPFALKVKIRNSPTHLQTSKKDILFSFQM